MLWWGKVIGALVGYLLTGGNPVGALFGILVGNLFDRGLRLSEQTQRWTQGATHQHQAQAAFFKATFLILGHVAKADGRVSEDEIRAAQMIMGRMRLTPDQTRQAIDFFRRGKQPQFDLTQALSELLLYCRNQRSLLRLFVDIQFQAAVAEGYVSPAKQQILTTLCQRLGFAPLFRFYQSYNTGYQEEPRAYQEQARQRQQQGQSYQRPYSMKSKLDKAYEFLELQPSATIKEIKRNYRKMISQHHPDKLIAQGLPEEMIRLATDKTQKIQSAYETIREARGFS